MRLCVVSCHVLCMPTMPCREEMEILLSAYIDNEVTTQERDTVERHLQECAACQATLTSFSRIHAEYGELEVKHAPRDFRQRVTQRLDERSRWRFFRRMPRLVYACSVAVLLIFGGVMATLSPSWFQPVPDSDTVAQVVDIYAEDILFGGTTPALDDMFAVDDTDITDDSTASDDFLDSIDFFDSNTSGVYENNREGESV